MIIAGVPQSLVLEPGPTAPQAAREHTKLACAGATSQSQADAVTLVVSELVTNAVHYGSGQIRLVLRVSRGEIFVAVQDTGSGFTAPTKDVDPSAEGGRGLFIVAHIASNWGVETRGDAGTLVWCVIPARTRRATGDRSSPTVAFLLGASAEHQAGRLAGKATA